MSVLCFRTKSTPSGWGELDVFWKVLQWCELSSRTSTTCRSDFSNTCKHWIKSSNNILKKLWIWYGVKFLCISFDWIMLLIHKPIRFSTLLSTEGLCIYQRAVFYFQFYFHFFFQFRSLNEPGFQIVLNFNWRQRHQQAFLTAGSRALAKLHTELMPSARERAGCFFCEESETAVRRKTGL